MKSNKILIILPLLPKYDMEFLERLSELSQFDIYVTADIQSKNQLTLNNYSNKKYTVLHTDIKHIGPFEFTMKLDKIIKNIQPDLIVYNANPRDLGQFFSMIKNKILGRKIASRSMYHKIGGPILYSTLYYRFLGWINDRNMSYTNTGKLYQIARGVNSDKIDVIGTAINEKEVFKSIEYIEDKSIDDLKTKYNLHEKFVLLQVVRLTDIKKPAILIDMMKLLITKDKKMMLVLIGGGSLEKEIKQYAIKNNVSENILFLGPIYDEDLLGNWFKLANIFVIPTCIGLSAHHACCYGLPIVTDDSLVNQASEFDILTDRLNCLLYKEGDLNSFVDKILELKYDKSLYDRISSNAVLTVKEIHTLDNKVNNYINSVNRVFE